MRKSAEVCQTEPISVKLCQSSQSRDNSNILRSLPQFGTAWNNLVQSNIFRHSSAQMIVNWQV